MSNESVIRMLAKAVGEDPMFRPIYEYVSDANYNTPEWFALMEAVRRNIIDIEDSERRHLNEREEDEVTQTVILTFFADLIWRNPDYFNSLPRDEQAYVDQLLAGSSRSYGRSQSTGRGWDNRDRGRSVGRGGSSFAQMRDSRGAVTPMNHARDRFQDGFNSFSRGRVDRRYIEPNVPGVSTKRATTLQRKIINPNHTPSELPTSPPRVTQTQPTPPTTVYKPKAVRTVGGVGIVSEAVKELKIDGGTLITGVNNNLANEMFLDSLPLIDLYEDKKLKDVPFLFAFPSDKVMMFVEQNGYKVPTLVPEGKVEDLSHQNFAKRVEVLPSINFGIAAKKRLLPKKEETYSIDNILRENSKLLDEYQKRIKEEALKEESERKEVPAPDTSRIAKPGVGTLFESHIAGIGLNSIVQRLRKDVNFDYSVDAEVQHVAVLTNPYIPVTFNQDEATIIELFPLMQQNGSINSIEEAHKLLTTLSETPTFPKGAVCILNKSYTDIINEALSLRLVTDISIDSFLEDYLELPNYIVSYLPNRKTALSEWNAIITTFILPRIKRLVVNSESNIPLNGFSLNNPTLLFKTTGFFSDLGVSIPKESKVFMVTKESSDLYDLLILAENTLAEKASSAYSSVIHFDSGEFLSFHRHESDNDSMFACKFINS